MTKVRNVPPPPGTAKPSYGRFIPKEELEGVQAWKPDSLGGSGAAKPPLSAPAPVQPKAPPPPPPPDPRELLAAARNAGYQDGLRDGMASAEAFKQTHARQVATQVGALVQGFDAAFQQLEAEMAEQLKQAAVALARQIVRAELTQEPAHIARIAAEAVEALLLSARHVRLRVHPEDLPLVEAGAAEALAARGASLLPDPAVSRGGCLVESDIANVDALIENRWRQAAALLGSKLPYRDPERDPRDDDTPR
jgi:flagellar assembly protein FliH